MYLIPFESISHEKRQRKSRKWKKTKITKPRRKHTNRKWDSLCDKNDRLQKMRTLQPDIVPSKEVAVNYNVRNEYRIKDRIIADILYQQRQKEQWQRREEQRRLQSLKSFLAVARQFIEIDKRFALSKYVRRVQEREPQLLELESRLTKLATENNSEQRELQLSELETGVDSFIRAGSYN